MTDKKNKKTAVNLKNIKIQKGLVCGPDGCSLADHFDWAKDKTNKDKK